MITYKTLEPQVDNNIILFEINEILLQHRKHIYNKNKSIHDVFSLNYILFVLPGETE